MTRAILFAGVFVLSAVADAARAADDDFRLRAHYYPGFSSWRPWDATIGRDGEATRTEIGLGKEPDKSEPFAVAEADVKVLIEKVRAAKFFDLKKNHSVRVTDLATCLLEITLDGKTREVSVYGMHELEDDDEVRAFHSIWVEVLKRVPPVNRDQKPWDLEPQPPGDFRVVATYGAGHSDWKSWEATVERSRYATQKVTTPADEKEARPQLFRMNLARKNDLVAKIRDAKFFDLPEKIEPDREITDLPTLILKVTLEGKTREVSVYGPSAQKDRPEAKRFLQVWDEVLREVPPPNKDQQVD